jgi:hypothetical protein
MKYEDGVLGTGYWERYGGNLFRDSLLFHHSPEMTEKKKQKNAVNRRRFRD